MDRAGEFFGQGGVDQTLALQAPESGERLADDGDVEVRFTGHARARMPGVTRGIVVDVQPRRFQSRDEFGAEALSDLTHLISVSDCSLSILEV